MAEGQTVTIGNKEYDIDNLSENARTQVTNLRIADQEINRLQMQMTLAKTARMAYAKALRAELPSENQ